MRALITGASGFVGSHLTPYLYEKGFQIWASYHHRRIPFPFPIRWIQTNLNHFRETLDLVRQSRPDCVFHLAAQTTLKDSWEDPAKAFQLNVGGALALLEGVIRYAPGARVILASSAQVYGTTFSTKREVRETDLTNPVSPYAGSKRIMELAALDFVKNYGLDVVIARLMNQVGVGQNERSVFSQFCRQMVMIEKRKKPSVVKVENENIFRDFIHVRDAVRAYEVLVIRGKRGEIYNVGSGVGILLKEAFHFLAKQARVDFKIEKAPNHIRKNDLLYAVLDVSKLKSLGWQPKESAWTGLLELLEDCRKNVV